MDKFFDILKRKIAELRDINRLKRWVTELRDVDRLKRELSAGFKKQWRWIAVGAAAGFFIAWIFGGGGGGTVENKGTATIEKKAAAKIKYWTCAMHPHIKLPKPGKCPICAMTLIPVKEATAEDGQESERRLVMSPQARALAKIQTAPVERKFVTAQVRMVGKVEYDETLLSYITAWVPGRIDRLYVDFTGVAVKKGDHMAYIYSPELFSTQEEYLQAIKSVEDTKSSRLSVIKETSRTTVRNAKEKLRLYGITLKQIEELEERGTADTHMTIYSPIQGIVIKKGVQEGEYVKTGTHLYAIADLSKLWIKLDAYESDLMWLRYGQKVDIMTEAYPGEIFEGRISFIDPILNNKTRTVKIRVNVDNSNGRLKPEMFVRAVVKSRVAKGGKIIDSYLAGKWICPMHPEFIRGKAGVCDICGMELVSAEELGYSVAEAVTPPMVIPATAPLITGKRAVVYVEVEGGHMAAFEGREVMLGARAGDYYLVHPGSLKVGEKVVVNGNFKIDSALQIDAKPSMMAPGGGKKMGGHNH